MDKLLNKAIENKLVRKPSQGFSDKVMSQIFELKVNIKYQPLISIKIWIGTVIAVVAILGISFIIKPQPNTESKFELTSKMERFFSTIQLPKIDFFMNFNLLFISAVCFALFLLLFFDLVLSRKK